MPPLVGGLLETVGGWFTTGLQGKNEPDDSNAAPHNDHNRTDIDNKRAGGQVHGERVLKEARLSEDERRLLQPQYSKPPKDAKPIAFPRGASHYDAEQDWNPRPDKTAQASMAAGSRRGGFKPQNTLGQNTRQSGKNGDPTRPSQKYGLTQTPRQLQTQASRGSNVTSKADFPEDSRPTKRRKMSNTPVDLTDDADDEPFGQAVGRQANKTYPASQASSSSFHGKSKKQDSIFASCEQGSVDRLLNTGSTLSEPRPANGNIMPSDRASARSSERAKSDTDDSRSGVGTKGSPVQLDEDDAPRRKAQKATAPSQLHPMRLAGVPPINLEQDVEEYVDRNQQWVEKRRGNTKQGSRHDMNGVNDVFDARTQARTVPEQERAPRSSDLLSERAAKPMTAQNGRVGRGARAVHDLDYVPREPRLAETFRRDDGEEQKPRPAKLVTQMQSASAPNRASLNSEDDVLNGPRTVQGTNSLSASPRKQPAESRTATRPEAPRTHEPSDRKATKVTRTGQPVSAVNVRAPPFANETENHDSVDDLRLKIQSIFCKACVLNQKGLELVWDDESSAFVLVSNRKKVRTPDNKTIVKIGAQEIHIWKEAIEYSGAWLRGSITEVSNGHILIDFADGDGLSQCYRRLLLANKSLKRVFVASQTMISVFDRKAIEQQQAYEKLKEKVSHPRQLIDDSRSRRHSQQRDEEEQIIYEEDEEPQERPPKARHRMQNDTLGGVLGQQGFQSARKTQKRDETMSKFFPTADEPRRSTRQSKPAQVKERTPSPVKWTQINSPKRWTHSVVYPDSGPRRVTVDYQDLERLDEGEFLNDNIVNYELRCIEENIAPKHKSKVHFFNTYFFSSLSQKNGKKDFNYEAVERWTKKTDLFNIPYIVIPINVELHWFVAIICNLPAVDRKFDGFDDLVEKPSSKSDEVELSEAEGKEAETNVSVEPHSSARGGSSPASNVFEFGEDGRVAAIQRDDTVNVAATGRPSTATSKKGKKKGPALRKYDPKEPIIMSLDSFAIQRSAEIKYLKLYVSAEARTKRGFSLEPGTLQGMSAKGIPEQPNFCDCGVYLLGYVAEFAKDPDTFVRKVLNREMDRENDFASFDASAKRGEIREKLLKLQDEQDVARRAQKKAKAAAKAGHTPKTQEASVPTSDKSAPPASTAQKSVVLPKTDQPPQSSMPRSSPCPPMNRKHSTEGDPDNESEELEVEPPSFVGKRKSDPSGDDDSDEMLLDDADAGDATKHSSRPATPQRQHAPDIYNRSLPVPSSGRRPEVSPLEDLERWAKSGSRVTKQDGPEIIDIGDEEDESKMVK